MSNPKVGDVVVTEDGILGEVIKTDCDSEKLFEQYGILFEHVHYFIKCAANFHIFSGFWLYKNEFEVIDHIEEPTPIATGKEIDEHLVKRYPVTTSKMYTKKQYDELKYNIMSLINDDSYAITFQTMGQYRSALIKEIDKLC